VANVVVGCAVTVAATRIGACGITVAELAGTFVAVCRTFHSPAVVPQPHSVNGEAYPTW
jgi:hypothetical protein